MTVEFKLPDLGEGIHEAEIVEVLVSVGDHVEDGQTVLLVETDKATTEVPSPVTGTVGEIRVKPGDTVKVGSVLMLFTVADAAVGAGMEKEPEAEAKPSAPAPGKPLAVDVAKTPEPGKPAPATVKPGEAKRPEAGYEAPEGPVPAAPSTRRLARELGVDLRRVTPGGSGGRVTSEDVKAYAAGSGSAPEASGGPAAAALPDIPGTLRAMEAEEGPPPSKDLPPLPDFTRWGDVAREPLKGIRRATARNMAVAWARVPHVSHQDVADVTELDAFRRRHKDEVKAAGGALSMTVFVLKAAVAALKLYPRLNSSLDTARDEIVIKRYHHVGVAVDSDRGLIVPVIRDVDRKSLTELAVDLSEIVARTREGKIDVEALQGGSFTLTNVGILGGTGFTPIVNYPQVAILGMGQARMQPVVTGSGEEMAIVPRLMLPLVLGFDHRVADGADAARFVNKIIEFLENPEHLFLEI